MSFKDRIKKFLNRNNPELVAGRVADKVADSYQEKIEEGEKDPLDKTTEELIELIEKHPERKAEILAKISEDNRIPDRVTEKAFVAITKNSDIPNSVVPTVINRDDTNISDKSLDEILNKGNFNRKDENEILLAYNEESAFRRQIIEKFSRLENESKKLRDFEVVDRIKEDVHLVRQRNSNSSQEIEKKIQEIKDQIENGIISDKQQEKLNELVEQKKQLIKSQKDFEKQLKECEEKVVVRKMAENYYSNNKRGTNIYIFSSVIPVEEMIGDNLASEVKREYDKILNRNLDEKIKEEIKLKEKIRKNVQKEHNKQIDEISEGNTENEEPAEIKNKIELREKITQELKNRVNVEDLRKLMFKELGNQIGATYLKEGTFDYPQLRKLMNIWQQKENKRLSNPDEAVEKDNATFEEKQESKGIYINKEEYNTLIKSIENSSTKTLSEGEKEGIKEHIPGGLSELESKKSETTEKIEKMHSDARYEVYESLGKILDKMHDENWTDEQIASYFNIIVDIANNKEKLELLENIQALPPEHSGPIVKTFNKTLEPRVKQEKLAKDNSDGQGENSGGSER